MHDRWINHKGHRTLLFVLHLRDPQPSTYYFSPALPIKLSDLKHQVTIKAQKIVKLIRTLQEFAYCVAGDGNIKHL